MLRSLKQLYGEKLGAIDGEIGTVKDFYFDGQNWIVRYLVTDAGNGLAGRKVLISPHSLSSPLASGKVIRVDLTRGKIEKSPSIGSRNPVLRQYEERYYKYYGWPPYWAVNATDMIGPQPKLEAHLSSAQAVDGYLVRMGDETIGHICDFMVNAGNWTISQLVVKTGHRLSGKDLLIPVKQVERISYEESTVFAYPNVEASAQSPANHLASARIIR